MTFGARIGRHDDLVLALAIACWRAFGGGPNDGILQLYAERAARLRALAEPLRTVVGVDLGQSRDPTAIAVVQRVPASRIEERPDRPRHEPPILKPQPEALYALGSVERGRQDEERRHNPLPAGAEWVPQ
jgi:hypothetical protein